MTVRLRQAAVTFALTLPLAISAWMAGPLATTTSAQPGQQMVGPRFPILIRYEWRWETNVSRRTDRNADREPYDPAGDHTIHVRRCARHHVDVQR